MSSKLQRRPQVRGRWPRPVRPLKKFVAFGVFYVVNRVLQEGSTMHIGAFPGGSRAALLLALLVFAATVTGVAASAAKTAIPKKLTGEWYPRGVGPLHPLMEISPRGEVVFHPDGSVLPDGTHLKFTRVTAHRLSISGPCSGRYRWKVAKGRLQFWKIRDSCPGRYLAGIWLRYKG